MYVDAREVSENATTAATKLQCLRQYWRGQHGAARSHCVIDLRYCRRIDSHMLGILSSLVWDATAGVGAAVELRNVRPHVRQLLEQRGMARLFTFGADAPEPDPIPLAPRVRPFLGRSLDLFRAEL